MPYENNNGRKVIRIVALAAAALGTMVLQACNTTEGVGKDVKATGNAIEDAAQDAKN